MRSKVFLGTLALLSAFAFVGAANAMVINGTDYVLFGKTAVKFEDGPTVINGNVAVNDVGGLIRIGAQNTINGTVTADRMFFGSGASVDVCKFNTSTGGNPDAVCDNIPPYVPGGEVFPIVAWPPQPVPVSFPVTNSDQVCPAGGALALPPGNYGELDVKDDCVLTLVAGTYNFKKIRIQNGSTTNGAGSTATFVNSNGSIITEPGITINGAKLTTVNKGTFEAIVIGNDTVLNDVILYAPNARMHLHQNGVYTNFEGVAVFITVEPIVIGQGPSSADCVCVGEITLAGQNVLLTRGCHLNLPNVTFFLATSCSTTCPGAGCLAATLQPGASDSNGTLTLPAGAVPGTPYHVIINSTAGTFCTAATITP